MASNAALVDIHYLFIGLNNAQFRTVFLSLPYLETILKTLKLNFSVLRTRRGCSRILSVIRFLTAEIEFQFVAHINEQKIM